LPGAAHNQKNIVGEIAWGGAQPKERLEAIRPLAQAIIDDANEPPEKVEQLPFKTVNYDFESGNASVFKAFDSKQSSVKLSIVSGSEAISGKSLKVELNSKRDGSPIYIISDPEKLGMVGWRNYLVSFKIKLLGAPGSENTSVTVNMYRNDKAIFGAIKKGLGSANEVISITDTIKDTYKNGKFGLRIGIIDGTSFVIDDIVIKEIP